MAIKYWDIDGYLLLFTKTFLLKLEQEKFELSELRFEFNRFSEEKPPRTYRTFANVAEFIAYYAELFEDPNIGCVSGMFPVLQSVKVKNFALKFQNSYNVRSITTSAIVQDDFKLDNYRETFNKEQVNTYNKYLQKKFINYRKDVDNLVGYRKDMYIEACYIATNYFETNLIKLLSF